MKFHVEQAKPTRQPVPITVFGKEWTDKLYARYHSLANKAKTKAVPFEWNSFSEFLAVLEQIAPDDYHPETHRFNFDLEKLDEAGTSLGYCAATMRVRTQKDTSSETRRTSKSALSDNEKLLFMGELTKLMLGGYSGTLEELIDLAKQQVGIK